MKRNKSRPLGQRVGGGLLLLLVLGTGACAPTLEKAEKMLTPSVKTEKEMGQEFAREAAKKLTLVEVPEVLEAISRIGEPILEAAAPMQYRFRFHVVKGPILNAFAVPGGHVYLYSGLLLKARNVHEVAAVIAHEISHVKHRHTAQMIGKGTLVNLATLAAILAAQGQRAVTAGAVGAGRAIQLRFSREFEREADRYGLFYLYQAGYDPRGLMDFFSLMRREQLFSTSDAPPYLLTHPMTPERMSDIENLIRVHRLEVRKPLEMPDFYRFQGILQAEVIDATRLIPMLKQRVAERPEDARLWHQLGLAHARQGWTREAIKALEKAVTLDPQLGPAWADLAVLQGNMAKWMEAETYFKRAVTLRPDYAQAYVGWGQLLLKLDEPRGALGLLEKAVALDSHLIQVHEVMATALKAVNDQGGYHEEMARYFEKLDRYADAIQHLKKALDLYGEETPRGRRVKERIEEIKAS